MNKPLRNQDLELSEMFEFLRDNAEWLFGGSGVLTLLLAALRKMFLETKTKKKKSINIGPAVSTKKEISVTNIQNNVNPLRVTQYSLIVITLFFGTITINNLMSSDGRSCVGNNSDNTIESGGDSTNIIAGDCSDVTVN